MSKIAIITAIYDDYDTLKPTLAQSVDVEWICVTDNASIDETVSGSQGWNIIVEPRPHLHPARAAKTPKCLPWLYTDASASIWIDASYQVISEDFAKDVISYAMPVAQFSHPWRDCTYDEAEELLRIPKFADQKELIGEQMWWMNRVYEHPKKYGLWATGVIARKHTVKVVQAGFDWLSDIYTWSYRDQLSHPSAMLRNHIRPDNLPGTHLSNKWLRYEGSGRHSHG